MEPKQNPLMAKMQSFNERHSLLHPKPQDLTFDEIVSRVAEYIEGEERLRIAFIFGNEVGEYLEDENDVRFDPVALFKSHPDQLDEIIMYVSHDMSFNEQELLSRKDSSLYAYNTLLFGAAVKLAHQEVLSNALRAFLVEHLIAPKPPKQARKRGRPKMKNDGELSRFNAIQFAVKHGLNPTRNDATENQASACDAVCKAASRLYQVEKKADYATGYSYESLKKLWHKMK